MEKYIIITEFGEQQDIRVGLKSCKNKYNLLLCWAKHLSYPYIGIKSKTKLIEDIKFEVLLKFWYIYVSKFEETFICKREIDALPPIIRFAVFILLTEPSRIPLFNLLAIELLMAE